MTELGYLVRQGKYEPLPDCYSKELKALAMYMLRKDPKDRPAINKIMTHPLIG